MNIVLGAPYEMIMKQIIERGYAGSQTEVIRQALIAYTKIIEEEEVRLVNRGIESEMQEIKTGTVKTKSLEELKKKYKL